MSRRKEIGDWGERQAALFLVRHGYTILGRNYRIREGEIDIIACTPDNVLSFVEVKTRAIDDGSAERATGWVKQGRIDKAALHYALHHDIDIDTTPIVFEHVGVFYDKKNRTVFFKKQVIE